MIDEPRSIGPDGESIPRLEFFAYETIGYAKDLLDKPTLDGIAARFRDAMNGYVSKTRVTPHLLDTIRSEIADLLDAHRGKPDFAIEVVPERSTDDCIVVRISSRNPLLAALLSDAADADVATVFRISKEGHVIT